MEKTGSQDRLLEGLAWLDPLQLVLRVPELARAPRGRGEPVMVLPGFAASDASTLALRRTRLITS